MKLADKANEPVVAVNPSNPQNIVVAYNHIDTNDKAHCGYSVSHDGGGHWVANDLPVPTTKGVSGSLGDPSLAFTPSGKLYFTCLAGYDDGATPDSGTAIALYSAVSDNGGDGFSTPTLILRGSKTQTKSGATTSVVEPDQEQLTASPVDGNVYICYAENVFPIGGTPKWAILLSRLDGSGKRVATGSVTAGLNEVGALGCTVGVAASGRVWVGWWNAGPNETTTTGKAEVAYSDRASTANPIPFTGHTVLAPKHGIVDSATGITAQSPRHVWVRPSPIAGDNRAMAVWENDGITRDLMTASYDGNSWSASSSAFHNIYQPALAWGPDGKVAVGFYQDASTPPRATSLLYTVGQLTWPGQVASLRTVTGSPSNATTDLYPFCNDEGKCRFGDYTSIAQTAGTTSVAWTDNRSGSQAVWFSH
jgi:hypothetical protein